MTCSCESYQCCEECMDKFDFGGKSPIQDCYDEIIRFIIMLRKEDKFNRRFKEKKKKFDRKY